MLGATKEMVANSYCDICKSKLLSLSEPFLVKIHKQTPSIKHEKRGESAI